MSFFGFGQSVEVEIVLNDAESRKRAEHKTEDEKKEKYFLFYDGETVSGKVSLALKHPNNRLEHQGIKIEFIRHWSGADVTVNTPLWVENLWQRIHALYHMLHV